MLTLFVVVFNVVTIAYGLDCDRHVSDLGAPWSSGLADYLYNCYQNSGFLPFYVAFVSIITHTKTCYSRSAAESHGDERSCFAASR